MLAWVLLEQLTTGSLRPNPAKTSWRIEHETKLSARIDGGHMIGAFLVPLYSFWWLQMSQLLRTTGMYAMRIASDVAIKKAQEHGFGVVGTVNTSSATGALGYWARDIARQNLIGQ